MLARTFSSFSREPIPRAIREQVWIKRMGKKYQDKCYVKWCENTITVFDFSLGHNIPVSKGGSNKFDNLYPICSRCNTSMGNKYTIKEWEDAF